jgi:hypothetical protein
LRITAEREERLSRGADGSENPGFAVVCASDSVSVLIVRCPFGRIVTAASDTGFDFFGLLAYHETEPEGNGSGDGLSGAAYRSLARERSGA